MTLRSRFCATMAVLLLGACTHDAPHTPAPRTAARPAATPGRIPPQDFAPGLTGEESAPPASATLTNDPSAPADTPLCGHAAREANAMSATIHPEVTPTASTCAANACFDAQTGTYIAADGSRRVCR
ncbi:hypothetical protein B0W47_10170 [Komagataeibacter nataicola]|uniref:Lectin-like protein BA14k n=2 Tax=Komagataeibacter nataicola TaxID=265960 RepID=A0A9N7H1K1_9PROT|nr:hypothetical protein B0W47_10170 [Komagataeibacter nataicola]